MTILELALGVAIGVIVAIVTLAGATALYDRAAARKRKRRNL